MNNKYEAQSLKAQKELRILNKCGKKKAYETKSLAFQKNQKTYKCENCGKWHRSGSFTSLVQKVKKRRKKS